MASRCDASPPKGAMILILAPLPNTQCVLITTIYNLLERDKLVPFVPGRDKLVPLEDKLLFSLGLYTYESASDRTR